MNWTVAVSEIGPRLYKYFGAVFSDEMAADLTQETLIRLVDKYNAGSFDPTRGSLLMYAYGIARLVRMEAWKLRSPEDPSGDPFVYAGAQSLHVVEENSERISHLRRCIAQLNDHQQQIVLLLIDEELTLQEISTMVELPVNTVKSHIHRAKEILRKKMQCEGE